MSEKSAFATTRWFYACSLAFGILLTQSAFGHLLGSTPTQVAIRQANKAYWGGDYANAETLFSDAIAASPNSVDPTNIKAVAYNNRGLARLHQGNFADADADFEQAKTIDPAYVAPYLNKGKCLAAENKLPAAIVEFQTALDLNQQDTSSAPLDDTAAADPCANQANSAFADLATSDARTMRLYFNLGWVYDELGYYADAIAYYDAALAIDPTYKQALLGRAVSLANQGETADAATAFTSLAEAGTGDIHESIAKYDLALMQGKGLSFHDNAAAAKYTQAVALLGAGVPDAAFGPCRVRPIAGRSRQRNGCP